MNDHTSVNVCRYIVDDETSRDNHHTPIPFLFLQLESDDDDDDHNMMANLSEGALRERTALFAKALVQETFHKKRRKPGEHPQNQRQQHTSSPTSSSSIPAATTVAAAPNSPPSARSPSPLRNSQLAAAEAKEVSKSNRPFDHQRIYMTFLLMNNDDDECLCCPNRPMLI